MRQGPNSLFVDGHPTFHRNPWNGYINPYYFGWWPSAIAWKKWEFSPRTYQPIPYQFSLHHYSYSTHGYPKWCFGKRWLLFEYVMFWYLSLYPKPQEVWLDVSCCVSHPILPKFCGKNLLGQEAPLTCNSRQARRPVTVGLKWEFFEDLRRTLPETKNRWWFQAFQPIWLGSC